MKTRFTYLLSPSLVSILTLLSSCQVVNNVFDRSPANGRAGIVRARKFVSDSSKGTLFWSHFDATKRSSIINVDNDGHANVLAESTPDAALQRTLELAGKASVIGKVDAETQLKTASTIAQLGQRTANVNMLRDALYRLAEGANNMPDTFYGNGIPNSSAETDNKCNNCGTLYERLFQATLSTYATAVKSEADATIAQAQAEKAKAEAEKAKSEAAATKGKTEPATSEAPRPSASGAATDSTATTDVSLKLEMTAKTVPVKKAIKTKGNKTKVKKQ